MERFHIRYFCYHSQQPGAHQVVARDAFGYTLSYYQGDYKPINGRHTGGSYFLANQHNSTFGQAVPDLFNACRPELYGGGGILPA